MVTFESILSAARRPYSEGDVALIRKAYDISEQSHRGQKRRSGDPYFAHPAEVARILTQHQMDAETVATGLLHDVVEDTLIPIETIEKEFSPGIGALVDGVTKLSKVSFHAKDVRQAESFRKMLLAMAKDIRVIIVKLADRLHNMRTLSHMPSMRQLAIAQETLEIYAPLANRLGMSWMKLELEDLSFQYLKPEIYQKIQERLASTATERDQYIARVIQILGETMKREQIRCEIMGRHKHIYSIFRKMEARNLDFDQIADILAFRIVVDSLSQCYEVLGHIHATWKPVPGKFKDYVALPKTNGYQSLHTTVIGPDGERIEIQIRTRQMHQFAEEGVAAHWIYKTGTGPSQKDVEKFGWLRQMVDLQDDMKDSHEFIESVKIDLFADEVYVFTPRGEVHEFPRGSTPIDFAYRIHTEVGHHCQGARINGRLVPLKYKLQNGDTVEILTSEHSKPTKDWLKFAVTSKAKSKIRAVIKQGQQDSARKIGREMLEKELKTVGENYNKLLASGDLKSRVNAAGYENLDDFMLAIGYGKVELREALSQIVSPEKLASGKPEKQGVVQSILGRLTSKTRTAITVGGQNDVMVRYGRCCNPLPGDSILGFVTRGRGVTVHKTDCFKVLEIDNERKVEVEWGDSSHATRSVRIKVVSRDVPGILANISQAITRGGGNISHASIKTTLDQKAINTFDVNVSDTEQLYALIRSIEKLKGIISVERVKT